MFSLSPSFLPSFLPPFLFSFLPSFSSSPPPSSPSSFLFWISHFKLDVRPLWLKNPWLIQSFISNESAASLVKGPAVQVETGVQLPHPTPVLISHQGKSKSQEISLLVYSPFLFLYSTKWSIVHCPGRLASLCYLRKPTGIQNSVDKAWAGEDD